MTKLSPQLSPGYYVVHYPDILILRRLDDSMVAAYSLRGTTSDTVRRTAESWLYGFSTYSKSNAVVINSLEDRYHEAWHIGWREHTFESRNDNVLIVGWEVVSNWNDGSNGSWWKAAPENLLEHYGAVHVKSQYDRGCDWTCRWYFVGARDYQSE